MAMSMMSSRSSGGSEPKLNFFLLVKTLLPIWSEMEDESPWIALLMPIPFGSQNMGLGVKAYLYSPSRLPVVG